MLGIRVVCLWPGLPGAWLRGKFHHLLLATAAAWLACFLLLATFVWPDWMGLGATRLLWGASMAAWLGFSVWGYWQFPSLLRSHLPEHSAALEQAQREYLQGHWFAAEAQLLDIIHIQPRDAEALLLLSSVLRQTRRWQPALRRLRQLELLDTAAPWRYEIAHEKSLIDRAIADDAEAESELAGSSVAPSGESDLRAQGAPAGTLPAG